MPIDQKYISFFSCLVHAGKIAEEIQDNNDFEVEEKTSKTDIVTRADKELSKFLISEIENYFPGDEIISEEEDQKDTLEKLNAPVYWLIDPIDGTWNYRNGISLWSPMMARVVNGKVVVAGLYYPEKQCLYVAEAGKGCWKLKNERWEQIYGLNSSADLLYSVGHLPMEYDSANSRLNLHKATVTASEKYNLNLRTIAHANAGLSGIFVAEGILTWKLLVDASLWDYAPIVLFAQEAGLKAITFEGVDWTPLDKWSNTLILGNADISNRLLETVVEEYKKLLK